MPNKGLEISLVPIYLDNYLESSLSYSYRYLLLYFAFARVLYYRSIALPILLA
jgi:hypothetical protein